MSLGDLLRATMFGTLVSVANYAMRIPMELPGHTCIWWMGILLVGRGTIRKFGAGIIMGFVSGILAVALGLGSEGLFVFLKYFIPGLVLDIVAPVYHDKLESVFVGGLLGAIISLSKMAANFAVGFLTNVPMLFLTLGLGYTAVCHAIFGAVGGVLSAIILKRLKPRLKNLSE